MSKPDFHKKGKVNTLWLWAVTLSFATAQEAVSCRAESGVNGQWSNALQGLYTFIRHCSWKVLQLLLLKLLSRTTAVAWDSAVAEKGDVGKRWNGSEESGKWDTADILACNQEPPFIMAFPPPPTLTCPWREKSNKVKMKCPWGDCRWRGGVSATGTFDNDLSHLYLNPFLEAELAFLCLEQLSGDK